MQSTPRREFIVCWVTSALGLAVGGAQAQIVPTTIVPESDGVAQALGYKTDSRRVDGARHPGHRPSQQCGNCHAFQGQTGEALGPCPYFGGRQVVVTGWCQAYSPRGGQPHH